MVKHQPGPESGPALEQVLGYLNFSSGAADPSMLANLNRLFQHIQRQATTDPEPAWQTLHFWLQHSAAQLKVHAPAFQDTTQAEAVLELVFQQVLPAYQEFHRDLLFHQTEEALFTPFFIGRTMEAVLSQGPAWNEVERIRAAAMMQLNDYIGHRPVATLETQKIEPYPNEWVRPVPLYVQGAGVSTGPYCQLVERAIQLLEQTDEDLLQSAYFDPQLLDELAFDPRAYDFDHPVNKRPNYHFGQWDPHHIDQQGRYRRFVVQQITLDALLSRLESEAAPRDELLLEAAAVLACTILMASGISGSGPDTHDSTTTLTTLLPQIAAYRDAFYDRLFARTSGAYAQRLRAEAEQRRQPFGGARQHLNAELARRRAAQLEHVHLAKIFAKMGHRQAARRQADIVPVASARMLCQIDCQLSAGHLAVQRGELQRAVELLQGILDLLHRAIHCGAVVDPWNLLGFDAHFSLFPALENSVHDHRAEELVSLIEQILALYSRIWSEAAAKDQAQLCQQVDSQFQQTAHWWRQFAAHQLSSVDCADPQDTYHAAQHVARALNLWHKAGAEAGDVRFWAPHAEMFDAPKAYWLVINALLDRGDFVASMALLVNWLERAERIPLEQGESSFFRGAEQWLCRLRELCLRPEAGQPCTAHATPWKLVHKFFDFLEANAEQYWHAPSFQLGAASAATSDDDLLATAPSDAEAEDPLYSAAYEDMVYSDSTDDGVDSSLFGGQLSEPTDELVRESERLTQRLAFLSCLARLWKIAAVSRELHQEETVPAECLANMTRWAEQAAQNRHQLMELLDAVRAYRLPVPAGDHDSMIEYDRRRLVKETLLDRTISTCVETADAARFLRAAVIAQAPGDTPPAAANCQALPQDEQLMIAVFAALVRQDRDAFRQLWSPMIEALEQQPLLYVPLSKGGNPREIVTARIRQQSIQDLLAWLPRRGFLVETCRLIETARRMERHHPVGPGAVTEFDELFSIGYKAMVETLVSSSDTWDLKDDEPSRNANLVACLEQLTESLLLCWLTHSRTLRLSVLEKVHDPSEWDKLVRFIQQYGEDLFTQRFLNLANVRAILHQGVDAWLGQLQSDRHSQVELALLDHLDSDLPRAEAVACLSLILEAIIENFGEYRDYNSTTTQSDRGDQLYMLLDFLRLRSRYDRICWNLKPVALAHEILVRRSKEGAAKIWRRALTGKINEEADAYLRQLAKLQQKYAMQMPTVADRLAERFVRPMAIDRMCALVRPAMEEARQAPPHPTFELLEHEAEVLTRESSGVGLDVPSWLVALEEAVERVRQPTHHQDPRSCLEMALPEASMSYEEVQRQLQCWAAEIGGGDDDDS